MAAVLLLAFICIIVTLFNCNLPFLFRGGLIIIISIMPNHVVWLASYSKDSSNPGLLSYPYQLSSERKGCC